MLSGTRVRIALAALATVPLAVGCAVLETGGTSSASCVFAVDYGDRQYLDAGEVDTVLGAKVGTARDSVCADQGGGEEDQVPVDELAVYTAYAVEGVDTEDAIAVRESPGGEVRVLVNAAEDEGMKAAVERVFGETGSGDGGDGSDSGDGGDGGDSGAAKCALVVEYGEGEYSYRGDVEFEVGAGAGEARAVPCGDTPGEADTTAEPAAYEAYEVKGLDPADAVAVRLSPDEEPLLVVRVTDDLPPEIEKLLPAEER
ncbi:DUF6281 family protein [Streptomyces caniscabiei]|uniref:Lipoprotein n=1 Tax=Streptomyces caniscabiei TaxID=2746961 RepID=A0A927QML6_9ACTN|nr:DUF6281 family protein [Streptomyces caniscabiei]MBD9725954.1 hypothetical protein [Streptomyces caniscabiei]MDX3507675.1 DUF6281 family protein [Streptomyces caniscabiei]MDX3717637.1 DUF6281 family protein [Streptomyces caniscabiei]WEO25386.1 DUF6281 family protein [Streptomyces caniscabiei]